MTDKNIRVRVCFLCKEYVPIHSDDVTSKNKIIQFDNKHVLHPVQTVLLSELNNQYRIWSPDPNELRVEGMYDDIF